MPSRLMRRSGTSAVHMSKLIGWRPKTVIQAGIGLNWEEVDCFMEQWPDIHFEGFEPNPLLIRKLKKANYPGNYYPYAIGDAKGIGELRYRRRHKDGSSLNDIGDKEDEPTKTASVEIVTLDEFFAGTVFEQPILLWLDCEGYELKALRGAEAFLEGVGMINVEMTGNPNGEGWCKPWEVHRFIVDHGFVLQYIHTFRNHQGQYDGLYVRPCMFHLEYSCSPCRCKDCGS